MDNMKKYFQKLRRFLRARRKTRKKAAWQNAVIAVLLAVVCIFALKGYAEENTFEAALDRYCEEHFFIDAELFATITYESGGTLHKNAMLKRTVSPYEYYYVIIWGDQESMFKWTINGYGVNHEVQNISIDSSKVKQTVDGKYDFSETGVPGINFIDFYGLHTEASLYGMKEEVIVTLSDDGKIVETTVAFNKGYIDVPVQSFSVNLETEECISDFPAVTMQEDFPAEGLAVKELWISDEHLISAAKIISEAITSVQ